MKYLSISMLFLWQNFALSQPLEIDSIDFYDTLRYTQEITYRPNGKIKQIEYKAKNSKLKKIDFFGINRRITRDQVWNDSLLKETKYTYLEKGQIIKRFDVLINKDLNPIVNINFRYPALAREDGIAAKISVDLIYDDSCIPIDFKVLNDVENYFEKEVKSKMKLFVRLSQKYKVHKEDCLTKKEPFIIYFKLD